MNSNIILFIFISNRFDLVCLLFSSSIVIVRIVQNVDNATAFDKCIFLVQKCICRDSRAIKLPQAATTITIRMREPSRMYAVRNTLNKFEGENEVEYSVCVCARVCVRKADCQSVRHSVYV